MPTVSTMPFIKPHFHNNGGDPATGYKLYSYDSTTQDAIPLYKDPSGTIEYPNPLTLNSRGEPDGMGLYLDSEKVYKLILKTENDVPVWTVNAVIGVGGGSGSSVPVINLPGHTVLGNITDNYGIAEAVEIVDVIDSNTDENLIPSVGAINTVLEGYLPDSGNQTFNGNLTVSGSVNANSVIVDGVNINDKFVKVAGHGTRTLVGNVDFTGDVVEDIPIVNDLTSGSANEIPSVAAVKTYVDNEVSDLEDQIAAITDTAKVKVSASDTADYLETKLVEGNRVTITKVVDGQNESLRFDLNLDDLKDISYVFQANSVDAGFVTVTNDAIFTGYTADPVNFGDAFDITTGRFTCSDTGYYHFDANALIDQLGTTNASVCYMDIVHYDSEGTFIEHSRAFASSNPSATTHDNFTIACSANFHLGIDDYVGIVFNISDAGATEVNKVYFGGFALNAANVGSGTPFKIARYNSDGTLGEGAVGTIDDQNRVTFGTSNINVNVNAKIIGDSNDCGNAYDAKIFGNDNIIEAPEGGNGVIFVIGDDNRASTPEGICIGFDNDMNGYGGDSIVVGSNNSAGGPENTVVGRDNLINSSANSTLIGRANNAQGTMEVIVGQQITSQTLGGASYFGSELTMEPYSVSERFWKVVLGTNADGQHVGIFGKYLDQAGNYAQRGQFMGFNADGEIEVSNYLNHLQFNIASEITPTEGQLAWNTLDKTLNIGLANGSVLQVGEEELVYAVNRTGTTINNGEVVYISGSQGNRVVVSRAQAVTTPTTQVFIAVATQAIDDNQTGYFTRFGLVRELNTAAFLEGDILWVSSTAGQLTSIQPAKPYSQIAVAIVTRAHITQGTIMVSPYVVPRLGQLTDVVTTGATNGQALIYSTDDGLWKPGTVSDVASDGKVKIDADDTADYLGVKLVNGNGTTVVDNGSTLQIDLDVATADHSFACSLNTVTTNGYVSLPAKDFGDFTISGSSAIIPVDGKYQVNVNGNFYGNKLSSDYGWYADYSSSSWSYKDEWKKFNWNSLPFGTWTNNERIVIPVNGKFQINFTATLYSTGTSIFGALELRHYASNGTLLKGYQCNDSIQYPTNHSFYSAMSKSVVINATGTDYVELWGYLSGTGMLQNITFSGAQVGGHNIIDGYSRVVELHHTNSSDVDKKVYYAYDAHTNDGGYSPVAFGQVIDAVAGDKLKINVNLGVSQAFITGHLSATMTQQTSVAADDHKVKVDTGDIAGFLEDKIVGAGAVAVTNIALGPSEKQIQIIGTGKIAVDSDDSTPDYASTKIVAGTNVTTSVIVDGGVRKLQINSTGGGGTDDHKVMVSSADTTPDYLYNKLTAGAGMTISTDDATVTLAVNPPQDSLQTFPIAVANGAGGTFDSTFGHITAVYVPYNTQIDRMACYVTQTGGASLYLCVYNSSYQLVCQSAAFTPSTYGVTVATLGSICSLTKNTRYYFGVVGSSNGCQLLKLGSAYASNEPFLAKFDDNISTPPATFGGSSSSDRFWIIGYKS